MICRHHSYKCFFFLGVATGYLTACFALMVGRKGHAAGVEHIPELVAAAVDNVNRSVAAP